MIHLGQRNHVISFWKKWLKTLYTKQDTIIHYKPIFVHYPVKFYSVQYRIPTGNEVLVVALKEIISSVNCLVIPINIFLYIFTANKLEVLKSLSEWLLGTIQLWFSHHSFYDSFVAPLSEEKAARAEILPIHLIKYLTSWNTIEHKQKNPTRIHQFN